MLLFHETGDTLTKTLKNIKLQTPLPCSEAYSCPRSLLSDHCQCSPCVRMKCCTRGMDAIVVDRSTSRMNTRANQRTAPPSCVEPLPGATRAHAARASPAPRTSCLGGEGWRCRLGGSLFSLPSFIRPYDHDCHITAKHASTGCFWQVGRVC